MSIKVTSEVWEHFTGSKGQLLTVLALADHAHDDGTHVFPSVASLARKTRQSERQVQRDLRALEVDGWIRTISGAEGGASTREFLIEIGKLHALALLRDTEIRHLYVAKWTTKEISRKYGLPTKIVDAIIQAAAAAENLGSVTTGDSNSMEEEETKLPPKKEEILENVLRDKIASGSDPEKARKAINDLREKILIDGYKVKDNLGGLARKFIENECNKAKNISPHKILDDWARERESDEVLNKTISEAIEGQCEEVDRIDPWVREFVQR